MGEMTKVNGPAETPLTDLLRGIPVAARMSWTEEDGLKATHFVPVGSLAHKAAAEIDALAARLRDAERDANRYRHCCEYGFPVRNQTGNGPCAWIAFRKDGYEFGETASAAIDSASAKGKKERA